jgi:ribonuclease P protein component
VSHSFPKSNRIRKSRQYKYVLTQGTEVQGRYLVLCSTLNVTSQDIQLGVVASRHYGNAIQRNRFKRLSREAFRISKDHFPKGLQLILKPRKHALFASLKQILEELKELSIQIQYKN